MQQRPFEQKSVDNSLGLTLQLNIKRERSAERTDSLNLKVNPEMDKENISTHHNKRLCTKGLRLIIEQKDKPNNFLERELARGEEGLRAPYTYNLN